MDLPPIAYYHFLNEMFGKCQIFGMNDKKYMPLDITHHFTKLPIRKATRIT